MDPITVPSGRTYTVRDPQEITMAQQTRIDFGRLREGSVTTRTSRIGVALRQAFPPNDGESDEDYQTRLAGTDVSSLDDLTLTVVRSLTDTDVVSINAYGSALISAYCPEIPDPPDESLNAADFRFLADALDAIHTPAALNFSDEAKATDPKAPPDASSD